MNRLILTVLLAACAVSAWGNVFRMGPRGDAEVRIDKVGDEYKVVCTFSPQTKFDSAINAKFNDAKGDSLCKKGLARYLNVGANDQFSISGLYSAAPVKKDGGKLHYSFAVPVSGCRVEHGAAKSKVNSDQVLDKSASGVTVEKVSVPSVMLTGTPANAMSKKSVRSVSYMSVVKYKEVNGRRSVVSHREYRGSDFGSRQEFDQLCASEFARIRAVPPSAIK